MDGATTAVAGSVVVVSSSVVVGASVVVVVDSSVDLPTPDEGERQDDQGQDRSGSSSVQGNPNERADGHQDRGDNK